jgi:ribose transport system substrate-binding protein
VQALLEKVMTMIRIRTAGSILIATLSIAACMYALNVVIEPPIAPRSHMLLIGGGTGEYWQRTLAGARDAARELGVDLDVAMPTPDDLVDQQVAIVRKINPGDYIGVAFSPADPDSQVGLINDLAGRTKLVTVDRDGDSQRLCHIGYGQVNAGALVARLVRDQLSRPGKVLLLATTFSDDARNKNVSQRLAGFKETWGPCGQDETMLCPIIEVATDSNLSATLADPQLAFIVALDSKAAESALTTLSARSDGRHVPIIAFDPSQAIFDAIADGRVYSAIFDDPYRSSFKAVQRLGVYCADKDSLPVPGRGSDFLVSEVVRKENLADIRRRLRS